MKKYDVDLFNKLIHNLKQAIWEIKNKRDAFHNQIDKLTTEHDEEMRKITNKIMETLDEAQELFEHLYDKTENGKEIKKSSEQPSAQGEPTIL